MIVKPFNIKHKNIMSVHVVEGDQGLIITNPKWEELDPMLQMDVMQDLKGDLETIAEATLELYEMTFSPKGKK